MDSASRTGLLLAMALFLACAVRTSHGTSEWDLTGICSLTVDKDLCMEFLRSDPRTDISDPPLLSIVSIELSLKHAEDLLVTFTGFRENSTNDDLAKSYVQCVSNYLVIIDGLNKAYGFSEGMDYDNVINATPPLSLGSSCEDGFPQPSPTASASKLMLIAIRAVSSVAQYAKDAGE